MEFSADHLVPRRDRQQDDRQSGQKAAGQNEALVREPPLPPEQPHQDGCCEHQGVLTAQRQEPERHADPQPRPSPGGIGDEPTQQRERQADQERVEHRFLNQAVEEDGGSVERQHQPGGDSGRFREQAPGREGEEDARERAEDGLHEPYGQRRLAEQRIDDGQEVRIERRLVEDLAADPFAARDLLRPRVVALSVAHREREERRPSNLEQVHQPDGQADEEDGDCEGKETLHFTAGTLAMRSASSG
jgi:hypothetical protein